MFEYLTQMFTEFWWWMGMQACNMGLHDFTMEEDTFFQAEQDSECTRCGKKAEDIFPWDAQ